MYLLVSMMFLRYFQVKKKLKLISFSPRSWKPDLFQMPWVGKVKLADDKLSLTTNDMSYVMFFLKNI